MCIEENQVLKCYCDGNQISNIITSVNQTISNTKIKTSPIDKTDSVDSFLCFIGERGWLM